LLCISVGTQGDFCFQDCTTNRNLCATNVDGRTACTDFVADAQGQIFAVCLRESLSNGSCDITRGHVCKGNQDPPLYCSQTLSPNLCREAVVQTTVGAACNGVNETTEPIRICDPKKQTDGTFLVCRNGACVKEQPALRHGACAGPFPPCDTSDVCLQIDSTVPAYCFERCPTPGLACANGKGTCTALQDGGGACIYGDAQEDQTCGVIAFQPNRYDLTKACGNNLTCITFEQDSLVGVCLREVTNCNASGICGAGRVCLPLQSGSGVCGKTCTSNSDCGADFACQNLPNFGNLCVPQDKGGILPFGGICDPQSVTETTRCCNRSGLQSACSSGGRVDYNGVCLRRDGNSTNGFCSAACDAANPCPAFNGLSTNCVNIGSGSVCLIPCASTANCPTGLNCENFPGIGNICITP
jgi:hypothetical protein